MKDTEYTESRPLRVFTAFSGYDSQCMALDRLGIPYELTGWSEIDKYAIQAHNAIYPQWKDRNAGDISKIDWDKVTDFDLFTMSSPCQDFSVAGLQKGGEEGSNTRSSLLWECRRAILTKKPRFILMENVKALVSYKFKPLFMKWQDELASYGYMNFISVLNAKDYGVPQNRERVFMVSILDDDASYHFPEPFPLERRLKDILEDNVDEKYYLSEKLVKYIFSNGGRNGDIKGGGGVCNERSVVSPTLTAQYYKMARQSVFLKEPVIGAMRGRNPDNPSDRTAGIPTEQTLEIGGGVSNTLTSVQKDNVVVEPVCLNSKVDGRQPSLEHRIDSVQGIATAVTTGFMPCIAEPQVLTPKRNEYGKYVRKAYEAGEVEESRHNMTDLQPREDGIANTLTSVQKDNLLMEPKIIEVGNYLPQKGKWKSPQRGRILSSEGISPTLDTMDRGDAQPKIIEMNPSPRHQQDLVQQEDGISRCIPAGMHASTPHLLKTAVRHRPGDAELSERQMDIRVKMTATGKISAYRESNGSSETELQIDNETSVASTVTTAHVSKTYGESTGFRIRKLTPRECFRLMDVDEENIDKIQNSGISNRQQYKMAGNSIVVNVLYHIFRKLFTDTSCESNQLSLF